MQCVQQFKYLGSTVSADGSQEREINRRLGLAAAAFYQLQPRVLGSRHVSLSAKIAIYQTVVLPTLLYGAAESWALTAVQLQRLEVFHTTCLRRMLGVRRPHAAPQPDGAGRPLMQVSNAELFERTGQQPISTRLRKSRLQWLGHLARMGDSRIAKQLLFAHEVPGARRGAGAPPATWISLARRDVSDKNMQLDWYTKMRARKA